MGNNSNYLLYDDVLYLMTSLSKDFPELISTNSIGLTYQGLEIPLITLTLNSNSTSAMLITGAHHARELASVQLPMYTVLRILHKYVQGDEEVRQMLLRHKLYIIPIVNVDGFKFISEHYLNNSFGSPNKSDPYVWKRKNMNTQYI